MESKGPAVAGKLGCLFPQVIAGEADMEPSERGDMRQQRIGDVNARRPQMPHSPIHVDCIPVDNRRDRQVEAGGPKALGEQGAIGHPALSPGIDGLS